MDLTQVGRPDDGWDNYVSLTINADGTCTERRIVGGEVVAQRELDGPPDEWPTWPQFS